VFRRGPRSPSPERHPCTFHGNTRHSRHACTQCGPCDCAVFLLPSVVRTCVARCGYQRRPPNCRRASGGKEREEHLHKEPCNCAAGCKRRASIPAIRTSFATHVSAKTHFPTHAAATPNTRTPHTSTTNAVRERVPATHAAQPHSCTAGRLCSSVGSSGPI